METMEHRFQQYLSKMKESLGKLDMLFRNISNESRCARSRKMSLSLKRRRWLHGGCHPYCKGSCDFFLRISGKDNRRNQPLGNIRESKPIASILGIAQRI